METGHNPGITPAGMSGQAWYSLRGTSLALIGGTSLTFLRGRGRAGGVLSSVPPA